MALIDCSECTHKISDKAVSCPQCGAIFINDKSSEIKTIINSDKLKADESIGNIEPKYQGLYSKTNKAHKSDFHNGGVNTPHKEKSLISVENSSVSLKSDEDSNLVITQNNSWLVEQLPVFISTSCLFSYILYIIEILSVEWANSNQDEYMAEKFPIEPNSYGLSLALGVGVSVLLWALGIGKWFEINKPTVVIIAAATLIFSIKKYYHE